MLYFCFLASFALSSATLLVSLPRTNVWVTLVNVLGLDTLCLSTATPENPFSTCLVSVPEEIWPIPEKIIKAM